MDRLQNKEREIMKPDRCSFCKGKLINGKTEFIARVRDEILVVKNVSALICNECGEAYYSPDESRKIDKLMRKFHESNLLVHPIPAGELSLGEVAA
jgi:YgiT-type zinc finger domain-containing protein